MRMYCATHFEHLIHAFFSRMAAGVHLQSEVALCCKLWHSRAVSQAGADEAVPVSLTDYARRRLCHDFHIPLNSLGMRQDMRRLAAACRISVAEILPTELW